MRLLVVLIVLGVLAPTGAVLWFMNDAARSQEEAARQGVAEAYRGQVRLVRDRVDTMWRMRAEALDKAFDLPSALQIAGADSAVLMNEAGKVVYPVPAREIGSDPLAERLDWASAQLLERRRDRPLDAAAAYARIAESDKDPSIAARAAQAQIRCLLAAGRKEEALAEIQRQFAAVRMSRARDLQGRSIAADEQLLALQLKRDGNPERLKRLLVTVDSMPTAQRHFLARELRSIVPETPPVQFESADGLALEFIEERRLEWLGGARLEATTLSGVWKLSSANRRVIALFRTETVAAAVAREFGPTKVVRPSVTPPGAPAAFDAIPAGVSMPGWQLSYTLDLRGLDEAARRQRVTYLWTGYAVVSALALIGLVVGGSFVRQMKLARLKTDLVAAVSHELKTPLASMRLLVDSLLEDGASDAKRTREYLELISGENARLTRLIENFLTFSRIERNRQRLEFAPTSPARIVEAAMASMRERRPGCPVEVDVSPDLPRIAADEDALVTVLLNLLDNAYKYTPEEKRIALRALGEGRGVAFLVQDNGIGIEPREQKRIFRRFYQVDRRLARETGGCGLGLSIVEHLVRAHGGNVTVKSAAGAGSTFRVWLPVEVKA
jgi:signal transduction histidine kinase